MASLVAQTVKNLCAMQETWVQSLGQEDPWEKGMATHSSILAWRILWTEEPGRLQFMGLQRVRHNWATFTSLHFRYHQPTLTIINPFFFQLKYVPFYSEANPKYIISSVNISCCCCYLIAKSCSILCNPMDCSLPASSVHGISQA